jgi:hypothetical protein
MIVDEEEIIGGGSRRSASTYRFGDVVQVYSTRNDTLHQHLFFIVYVDNHKMKLLDIQQQHAVVELKFAYDVSYGAQVLMDESIDNIHVVNRSKDAGVARQFGLLPETWVDLEFGGDIPQFVTGKITDLQHDMIELTTLPAKNVMFIDFAYQGIPEHIPLRKIRIRDGPPKHQSTDDVEGVHDDDDDVNVNGVSRHPSVTFLKEASAAASLEWNLDGEMIIEGLDDCVESQSYHVLLEKEYLDADRLMSDPMAGTATGGIRMPELMLLQEVSSIESYTVCEHLRTLLSGSRRRHIPAWWIPVWKTIAQDDDDRDGCEKFIDGLLAVNHNHEDIDIYGNGGEQRVLRQQRRGDNVSAWIILPPSHVPSATTSFLEQLDAVPMFLWRLFPKDAAGTTLTSVSPPAHGKKWTWPPTLALLRASSATTAVLHQGVFNGVQPVVLPRSVKRVAAVRVTAEMEDTLAPLLAEQSTLVEQYQTTYGVKSRSWVSSSEQLLHVVQQDHAAYLTMLLRCLTLPHLTLSSEMTNTLSERMHKKMADFEDMNQVGKLKAGDCTQRILTKRYTTLSDVHKDSHGPDPIYFDAEFDDTPYDLLKPLEEEFGNTTAKPTELEEFVAHNLIERHNYMPKMAQEVAETMISRKRQVKEGHYAILESAKQQQQQQSFYYRRTHNDKWILDKTVDATVFVDTPTLFCNMDKICMRDASAPLCQTPEDAHIRLQYLEQRRTLREVQTRITASAFQTSNQLETEANRLRQCLKRRSILLYLDLHRYDEYHGALGHLSRSYKEVAEEVLRSPHVGLRDRILGDGDFVRRNQRILDFVVRHCREALGSESPHWWYCNETVPAYPLIPVRVHRLAAATWSRRVLLLEEAVVEEGGYVDPDTGYTLAPAEFVYSSCCDYIVDVVDADVAATHKINIGDKNKIRDILTVLCTKLHSGVQVNEEYDSALRIANELDQEIPTATQYKKMTKPRDGAPFLPYTIYRDRECILRTTCALLFAIQTTASPHQMPWKRAVAVGYPLDTDEKNVQGLSILSTLLSKLKSKKRQPWDCLNPWNEPTIRQALVLRCRTLLIHKPKYDTLLKLQRQRSHRVLPCPHLRLYISLTHDRHPIRVTHTKQFEMLDHGFSEHVTSLMTQGNRKQHDAMNAIKCKSWIHAYGVLEEHDVGGRSLDWIRASRIWQHLADQIDKRSQSQLLAIQGQKTEDKDKDEDKDEDKVIASVPDRIAWSALAWYHHLDQPGPVPDRMRALGWIREKPADYDSQNTLEENKTVLSNAVKLDMGKFKTMMKIISQDNCVYIPQPKHLERTQVGALRDVLTSVVKGTDSVVLGRLFCQLLDAHLLIGKDDEDTALALMEEITVQRMAMWTQIRHSFARDQVHRIQVLLRDEPRNLTRIRNLTRVFPRLYADEIPENLREPWNKVLPRLTDVVVFLEYITPHILDTSMVDAIFVYTFLVVIREYLNVAKSNSYVSDWVANLLSTWLLR